MKGVLSALISFFSDRYTTNNMNIPLLVITLAVLLAALVACIAISKKNKLYLHVKQDDKENAYT